MRKLVYAVSRKYFWPGLYRDVVKFVQTCETCQRAKVSQDGPTGLMRERSISEPWEVVAADVMGPFPRSKGGNSYLLVIQDLFTRWVELKPLKRATGKNIGEALENLVLNRWGAPRVFLSDNGTEFVNKPL